MKPNFYIVEKNYGYKKPELRNLLPFLIYRGTVSTVVGIPQTYRDLKQKYHDYKERKRLEEEEAKEAEEEPAQGNWLFNQKLVCCLFITGKILLFL